MAEGLCSASVEYSSEVIAPVVNLAGTTDITVPGEEGVKFLTGQQITATVGFQRGPAVPVNHAVDIVVKQDSRFWRTTGAGSWNAFKDYIYNNSQGYVARFTRGDLTAEEFKFYSKNHADAPYEEPGHIECDFTMQLLDGTTVVYEEAYTARSKTVTSVRPEKVTWIIDDGTVQLLPNPAPDRLSLRDPDR